MGGLLGGIDMRLPFWVSAGLALRTASTGSSSCRNRSRKIDARRSAFQGQPRRVVHAPPLSHPELLGLAAVLFLYYLAHQVLQSTFVLYTGYRYGWGPSMVGLNLMGVGVGSIIVQALVVGPFVRRFGERGALYTGLVAGIVGFIIYGVGHDRAAFWLGLPIFSLMGLCSRATRGS